MMLERVDSRWLFWGATLIWASTWHVILYQLDSGVPAMVSVGWRFAIAAAVLAFFAKMQGQSLRMPVREHVGLLLAGLAQYSVNYLLVYQAERHVPSGLVAVLFSLMIFGNAWTGWLCFQQRVSRAFLLAALSGCIGVALVFWPEIAHTQARPTAGLGLLLGLGAVVAACTGNVLTLLRTRRGLALVPVLAWSMGYGALALLMTASAMGMKVSVAWTAPYLLSLFYLSFFGSVVAFLFFFVLAQRESAARASLMGVIIPVIALLISAVFEGWEPSVLSVTGMALCLGSVFVATRQK